MKKNTFSSLILTILFILVSCKSEELDMNGKGEKRNIKTFLISMPKQTVVRSTNSDTSSDWIDINTLKIFMFDNGSGKFIKQLTVNKFEYDKNENTYKVPIAFNSNISKVDLVFVANVKNINIPTEDQKKNDYCKSLTINLSEKWNPTERIPLWGECSRIELNEFSGTIYNEKISVSLIRALAQISFVVSNDSRKKPNIHKTRLKLRSVYVYNSLGKVQIIPNPETFSPTDKKVTAPSLPLSIAEKKPISYLQKSYSAITDYEIKNLIYVPEQLGKDNKHKSMFLIIGAIYGDSKEESYYRIDLKSKDNEGEAFNILRNHNYIIDIKNAVGPGYSSINDAVNNRSDNIKIDIIAWDNYIDNAYIWGENYFGIDGEGIVFEGNKGLVQKVKYKTNLSPEQVEHIIDLSFSDPNDKTWFSVTPKTKGSYLEIKTLKDNIGIKPKKTILSLSSKFISKGFSIPITQKPIKSDYKLLCQETKVYGVYQKNVALDNANNYIEVTVYAKNNIENHYYEITTTEEDGISFKAIGTFPPDKKFSPQNGYHATIKLRGSGTPQSQSPKVLTINPNSTHFSACEVVVKMAYSMKKIAAMAYGDQYGYACNTGYSKYFLTSKNNFGLTNNSIVKVPSFVVKYPPENSSSINYKFSTYFNNLSTLERFLNEKPDIFMLGYDVILTRPMAQALVKYLKADGCLILFLQRGVSVQLFFDELYKGTSVNVGQIKGAEIEGPGACYPFIPMPPDDPIANGPFGSTNGKSWGEDKSTTAVVTGLPEQDLIIYSRSVPTDFELKRIDKGVTIFRHKHYNLVFMGDGGFISGYPTTGANKDQQGEPFLANRTAIGGSWEKGGEGKLIKDLPLDHPIPKSYGGGYCGRLASNPVIVYNSVFFANTMAYMIDRAEFHGINSKQ